MYSIIARLDGVLVVHAISPSGVLLPGSRRVVPLGGGPVHLTLVPAQGSAGVRVVAAGKRAVTLSIVNKRLSISALPITVRRASLASMGETQGLTCQFGIGCMRAFCAGHAWDRKLNPVRDAYGTGVWPDRAAGQVEYHFGALNSSRVQIDQL